MAIPVILVTIASSHQVIAQSDAPSRDTSQIAAEGVREAITYNNASSVKIFRNNATMLEFRFRGHYTKNAAPTYSMPVNKAASVRTDLGAESTVKHENWYAIFAVAQNGDRIATLKLMPFLRASNPIGTVVPLTNAGEGMHDLSQRTAYSWKSKNNLAGTKILIISENGRYSGNISNITRNDATSITLKSAGNIKEGDFLLPAPPGYENFVYLGSFYFDKSEIRNIYDSGSLVKARMIYISQPDISRGEIKPPGVPLDCSGYISPLATAVTIESTGGLSGAGEGNFVEYFSGDGSDHTLDRRMFTKTTPKTSPYLFSNITLPFLYYQKFHYHNAGSAAKARVAGKLQITGWIEP